MGGAAVSFMRGAAANDTRSSINRAGYSIRDRCGDASEQCARLRCAAARSPADGQALDYRSGAVSGGLRKREGVNRFAPHKRTQADRDTSCATFLWSCRPHMLDAVTVDELVSRYGGGRKAREYQLTIAKQKRATEPREVRA